MLTARQLRNQDIDCQFPQFPGSMSARRINWSDEDKLREVLATLSGESNLDITDDGLRWQSPSRTYKAYIHYYKRAKALYFQGEMKYIYTILHATRVY